MQEFEDQRGALYSVAKSIDRENPEKADEICNLLLELHFVFEDYIWQMDEIHELVKKMAGNYRDNN